MDEIEEIAELQEFFPVLSIIVVFPWLLWIFDELPSIG